MKSRRVRRHYLNDGDVVLIGKHELIYVDERLARTRGSLNDTVPGIPVLKRADGMEEKEEEKEEEYVETAVGLETTRDQS